MQASGNVYADELPVYGSSYDDLDMFLFRKFYEKEYGLSLNDVDIAVGTLLENLKLAKDSQLTLAGLLLFGKEPERIKPQFGIKAITFIGKDVGGNQYIDSEDIEGILSEQYENSMAFIKRNLRKEQKGQNFNFPGIIEVPEIALQEAVVNALVHRDYMIQSNIKIFIFDDRIEIISPGVLPNTATLDNIKHGIQIARNPILLSFMPKLKIPYRGIGTGIRRMMAECMKAGIKEPDFIEDKKTTQFKVIFYR